MLLRRRSKRVELDYWAAVQFGYIEKPMSDEPWPSDSQTTQEAYRSLDEREHLHRLFGTDRPVAWITGSAADRVGRAVAKRFAARGYRVVLHANRSVEAGVRVAKRWNDVGVETMLVTGAIEEEATVNRWIEQINERFGRLDVLVHSAAVWEPMSLEETTSQLLIEQFMSNTLGSFLCGQKAGLAMAKQSSGGAIVLTGDWAICRPYRDFSAYFASKGSIPTLTRSLAVEFAERNPRIRVNAVLPGPVLLVDGTPDATQQAILRQCLLQRAGTADHVARAAVFLAEHEFLTGVCLPVDGGRSIYAGSIADAIAHPSQFGAE